jgi:hypothetical protein
LIVVSAVAMMFSLLALAASNSACALSTAAFKVASLANCPSNHAL